MDELKKSITLWKGIALAVCIVIGSGLLGLPGLTLEIGNVYASAGGWMLITIVIIPLIYIFASLGYRFVSSAGLSKYAEEAVGAWGKHAVSAVLCGTFTIGIPGIALIGGAYTQKLFGLADASVFWLAAVILIAATLSNLLGVKVVNVINTSSLIALIVMVLIIILSNIPFLLKGITVFGETLLGRVDINPSDLWKIAALLFWAFLGWENLSFSLEEFKNPEKNIPRVYWFSFVIVIFLYMGLTITSVGAQASGLSVKGASGLTSLIARTPIGFFQLLIMVLVIPANASAWIFGGSRLFYASGRDRILPSVFGRLSKTGVPLASLILSCIVYIAVLGATYLCKIPLANLVLLVSQNFLVLYLFSIFAYWKIEKRKRRWPVTCAGICSCVFLLSGFSWWMIYPLMLLLIGYLSYYRNRKVKLDTKIEK